ncbi:transcription factor bHLH147-like [Senna tora]|uniref:Transcription factor bHLH147-like n=1 Tax=Senna tora TaxID=362788 RepID=A0A834SN06_9FABA|nr:transcription factor bHLH147-like [Senna tora]
MFKRPIKLICLFDSVSYISQKSKKPSDSDSDFESAFLHHMASSLISSNPLPNSDRSRDAASKRRRKKKASELKHQHHHNQQQDQIQHYTKWKSHAQQQIYSSKLHQALARVNHGDAPRRGKAVREAADRALAVAAKGRTRWSRAILTSRLKIKFRKQKKPRITAAAAAVTGSNRWRKPPRVSVLRLKGKSVPGVQRKVRFLGRLVPGCRKEPFPVILEETIDYISALQMQIRAMSDLADRLSTNSISNPSSSSSTL